MVEINPFRALRYQEGKSESWGSVIAPPYDVIDPEEQDRLHQLSPYNVVRLILGKRQSEAPEHESWYYSAKRDYESWRRNGILVQDASPALYVIEHRFEADGRPCARLGFTALLELRDDVMQHVHRHEQTLSGPKADRTRLLETIPANLESIFCVYPDDGGQIQGKLREITGRQSPTAQATVMKKEEIRLWAVVDTGIIHAVKRHLSAAAVLIADGHHRFEVAYNQRHRYKVVMSHFVSMGDPALVVHPIHRFIPWQDAQVRSKLETVCDIKVCENREAALRWLTTQQDPGRFGWSHKGKVYTASVKPEQLDAWLASPSVPTPMASLDVSILHGLILPAIGVPHEAVRYHADASRVEREAAQSPAGMAWFLRALALTTVYKLASNGMVLPPKSTYFYPKVWSGLTINPLT